MDNYAFEHYHYDHDSGMEKLKKELGTNLAEVSTDCISRQAAIDA